MLPPCSIVVWYAVRLACMWTCTRSACSDVPPLLTPRPLLAASIVGTPPWQWPPYEGGAAWWPQQWRCTRLWVAASLHRLASQLLQQQQQQQQQDEEEAAQKSQAAGQGRPASVPPEAPTGHACIMLLHLQPAAARAVSSRQRRNACMPDRASLVLSRNATPDLRVHLVRRVQSTTSESVVASAVVQVVGGKDEPVTQLAKPSWQTKSGCE
jgi:hypothetical protein